MERLPRGRGRGLTTEKAASLACFRTVRTPKSVPLFSISGIQPSCGKRSAPGGEREEVSPEVPVFVARQRATCGAEASICTAPFKSVS